MSVSFKIEGLQDLEQMLITHLPGALGRTVLRRSLRKAAQPMLEQARAGAPGSLDEKITLSERVIRPPQEVAGLLAAGRARRRAQLFLGPGREAPHAHLVEFGTKPRYHKSGKYVGAMPPDPYMRPAFDIEAQPTIERLGPILASEIDKAIARRARKLARLAAQA